MDKKTTKPAGSVSVTQATNIASTAGALVVLIRFAGVIHNGTSLFDIDEGTLLALLGALTVIFASVTSYVDRFRKGDITLLGVRK